MNHKLNWNSILRLLQQGLQIIGATKNEQMVISIVPYITLYNAIYPQHASRKLNSEKHMIFVKSKADGPTKRRSNEYKLDGFSYERQTHALLFAQMTAQIDSKTSISLHFLNT